MIIVCRFWRVVKPPVMRLPIIPGTPRCAVTNQSYLVYISVCICQAPGLSPTERGREGVLMPWHGCCWSVERWELRGLVEGMGELQDIHSSFPACGWSCGWSSTAHGWSEELGLKYFSSEKRCCVLSAFARAVGFVFLPFLERIGCIRMRMENELVLLGVGGWVCLCRVCCSLCALQLDFWDSLDSKRLFPLCKWTSVEIYSSKVFR